MVMKAGTAKDQQFDSLQATDTAACREATLEALEMYAYAVILITQALGSGNLNPGPFPSPCNFTLRQVIQSVASQRW